MKTLASPCKIDIECYRRQAHGTKANHQRGDVGFWPTKKLVSAVFLRMVSAKYQSINPIAASSSSSAPSSLSPEPQVNLETLESEEQGTYQTRKRVHVKFQIQKECSFGEQFMIVGDDPMLGLWNPAGAIPLQWSDGHVWTVELDVPADETIQYKFILKGVEGIISWQPGPDRILKTWDTEKTIFLMEDWENAALQKITEEEPSAHGDAEPEITSEMLIVADIMTHQENIDSKVGNGSVAADASPEFEEQPLSDAQRKPLVADNIVHAQENSIAYATGDTNDMSEEMKGKQLAAESSEETNGRIPLATKSSGMDVNESLITHEGESVLVPGLPPVSESFNVERSITFDGSPDDKEVMDHHLPEPDKKCKSKNDQHQAKMIEEINENQHVARREPVLHEVLDNDIQWGRRTLQTFLSNFGLL